MRLRPAQEDPGGGACFAFGLCEPPFAQLSVNGFSESAQKRFCASAPLVTFFDRRRQLLASPLQRQASASPTCPQVNERRKRKNQQSELEDDVEAP